MRGNALDGLRRHWAGVGLGQFVELASGVRQATRLDAALCA
jgi:hypothetical protein